MAQQLQKQNIQTFLVKTLIIFHVYWWRSWETDTEQYVESPLL